jgi:hypothetical protein
MWEIAPLAKMFCFSRVQREGASVTLRIQFRPMLAWGECPVFHASNRIYGSMAPSCPKLQSAPYQIHTCTIAKALPPLQFINCIFESGFLLRLCRPRNNICNDNSTMPRRPLLICFFASVDARAFFHNASRHLLHACPCLSASG